MADLDKRNRRARRAQPCNDLQGGDLHYRKRYSGLVEATRLEPGALQEGSLKFQTPTPSKNIFTRY